MQQQWPFIGHCFPQEGASFSQAPDKLLLSALQLRGSTRYISWFSHLIKCKMFCFLLEAHRTVLAAIFLSFFISRSHLQEVACNFLRSDCIVNRHAVCVPLSLECRCAGVRENKTSYSFSVAPLLSFLQHREWKCWKLFWQQWRHWSSEHWTDFQWQEVMCVHPQHKLTGDSLNVLCGL